MEEQVDFYFNENGLMVLTEKFLLERGYCCGNGCLHCPYNHVNVLKEKIIIRRGGKKDFTKNENKEN